MSVKEALDRFGIRDFFIQNIRQVIEAKTEEKTFDGLINIRRKMRQLYTQQREKIDEFLLKSEAVEAINEFLKKTDEEKSKVDYRQIGEYLDKIEEQIAKVSVDNEAFEVLEEFLKKTSNNLKYAKENLEKSVTI